MAPTSEVRLATARLARLHINGAPSVEEIADGRRAYATAKIADCIEKTFAANPPLTAEQRQRLIKLIQGR